MGVVYANPGATAGRCLAAKALARALGMVSACGQREKREENAESSRARAPHGAEYGVSAVVQARAGWAQQGFGAVKEAISPQLAGVWALAGRRAVRDPLPEGLGSAGGRTIRQNEAEGLFGLDGLVQAR